LARISTDQVHQAARFAGIDMDGPRAEMIAARLSLLLDELDAIPPEALADVEPLPGFDAAGRAEAASG
jgi:hypothetical protein